MTSRLLVSASLATLFFASAVSAEDRYKYPKLKPADPPCLFLQDENTGEPTGDPVNTPCVLGNSTVNPGDNVSAGDRAKFGKAAPKDAASGMASGKRQHKPITAKKPTPPKPKAKNPSEPAKPPGQD